MTTSTIRFIAMSSAALLIAALLPLPYGYYHVLRWVICLSAATLGATRWNHLPYSGSALVLVAIVFNPLSPIFLGKEVWAVADIAGAAIFLWVALHPIPKDGR